MKYLLVAARVIFAFAVVAGATETFGTETSETSHLAFVTEYIRELAAIEHIHVSSEQELKQDTKASVYYSSEILIHSSTLFQLELGSQIRLMQGMHLSAPFEDLIPNITTLYDRKIALWQRMTEIGSAFIGGPKTGADYGKMVAEMPQIRAQLDYLDRTLFQETPVIFATLIDRRNDSKNHASHLIITKAEKAKLLDDLRVDFGRKLDQKNLKYTPTVGAARVLRNYLLKGYKCSDEPWE